MNESPLKNKVLTGIGLMSGTSLDGLDLAGCSFSQTTGGEWTCQILKAETLPYPEIWKERLRGAASLSGLEIIQLHKEYGTYLGKCINLFLKNNDLRVDFISSHGHTVFHQPGHRLTFQLGDGAFIAAETGITTVSDFRNLDVALGGQGAPLVPAGDSILFPGYDQYLNLGGFSNISCQDQQNIYAFDISPVNIILNYYVDKHFGLAYDNEGKLGEQGQLSMPLLEQLNQLKHYHLDPPKSLGWEWVQNEFIPLLEQDCSIKKDQLRTIYEHIAIQIGKVINKLPGNQVLVTGGGAFNTFLVKLITRQSTKKLRIPDNQLVEYKEALIFAYLGLLRLHHRENCLSSVTGASHNNIGGVVHRFL